MATARPLLRTGTLLPRAGVWLRFYQPYAGRRLGMSGWLSRFLAAIGIGGGKAEADVSYDPALDDRAKGGAPGPGDPDLE
jgi:hypothetical protein